jgi:hydrogen peroxide-dependent heme synthase
MQPLPTAEGWHVLHLFYRLEPSARGRIQALQKDFLALIQSARKQKDFQILTVSMIGHKADLGFMALSPDLTSLQQFEKRLSALLGPAGALPVYSYLSMTEKSEYTTSDEEYAEQLEAQEKLKPGTPDFEAKMAEFRARMEKYLQHRLYPALPSWPIFCFYPMSKRRAGDQNWYALDFATRKKLMEGHARVGRKYSGKILQLITGSTGLDGWEWGVTLLAHDLLAIKQIVYEMRFDEVSASYADFGDFYIGLQLPAEELIPSLSQQK